MLLDAAPLTAYPCPLIKEVLQMRGRWACKRSGTSRPQKAIKVSQKRQKGMTHGVTASLAALFLSMFLLFSVARSMLSTLIYVIPS